MLLRNHDAIFQLSASSSWLGVRFATESTNLNMVTEGNNNARYQGSDLI